MIHKADDGSSLAILIKPKHVAGFIGKYLLACMNSDSHVSILLTKEDLIKLKESIEKELNNE